MLMRRGLVWWLLMVACTLLFGCGGGGGGSQTGDTGNLQVALTDAQNPDMSELVVSILEIRAIPFVEEVSEEVAEEVVPEQEAAADEEEEWIVLATFDPPVQINVLDLAYQQELLADVDVPLGDYEQVRLVLEENPVDGEPVNYIVFTEDIETMVPVVTPSGQESGLKINGDYSVEEDGSTVVVLDFDPNRAIHQNGSGDWIFRPTGIRLVESQEVLSEYGGLFGHVLQEVTDPATAETTTEPLVGALVEVTDPETGEVLASTIVNPDDGSYRVFLPNGFYAVTITADGMLPFESMPQVFKIVEGEETVVVSVVLNPDPAAVADEEVIPEEEPGVEEPQVEEPPVEEPQDEEALPAQVRFWLADTDGPEIPGGFVSVSSVDVHTPGGWVNVFSGELSLEIGALPAEEAMLLGEMTLPSGKYTQIRIGIAEAVIIGEEEDIDVKVPSGTVKLNRNIDICSGGEADIVIDLGAGKSLSHNAKKNTYRMQPVPSLVETTVVCPESGE